MAASSPRARRIRFLLLFLLLLVVFEVPLLLRPVDRHIVRPFTTALATVSGGLLNAIGTPVKVSGTTISGGCFAVDIHNGCNGVETMLFLSAAVLAFPATVRQKLAGVVIGSAVIQAVNLVRILSLYLLGCYRRSWFEVFHLSIWQTIVFGVAIACFVIWTRRAVPTHAAQRA